LGPKDLVASGALANSRHLDPLQGLKERMVFYPEPPISTTDDKAGRYGRAM
jgi:hypothetical protein